MSDTEINEYDIDMEAVLNGIGVNPALVEANTFKVEFLQGKAIARFNVVQAIPPRVLATALLQGSPTPVVTHDEATLQETPTPIRPADRKPRTSKRAAAKKAPGRDE